MNLRYPYRKIPPDLPFAQSMFAKLLLFFFVVALLPLALLCYFSYHKSAQIVNAQFGNYGMYAIDQLKLQLDNSITQMDTINGNILTYLISTPIVIEEHEPDNYNQFLEEKALQRYLISFESMDIVSVSVITPGLKIIGNGTIDSARLKESPFWSGLHQQTGRQVIIHEPDYYYNPDAANLVISLVVPVKNRFGLPQGSKIMIDIKADSVDKLLQAFERNVKAHLQIRSVDGKILLQSSASYAASPEDIVWSGKIEPEGWIVEASIPRSEFYRSSGVILKYSLLVAVAALLFGVLMAGFFSFRLTRPIKKLAQSMRRFGEGELFIQTPVHSSDEMGFLSQSFNLMTGQIQELVREISRTEKLKSEAELRALHYQINPHLLFNTLNSLQWKARLAGQKDIQKMLEHLIVVLDSSLSVSQTLIPLEMEVDVALHFIEIQRFRYDDAFGFTLHLEPGLEQALIPRMVLQPLLENIFFHGFVDGQGEIELEISSRGGQVVAELRDNGIGIKPDNLEHITSGGIIPGKKGGLGLRNVDERFRMHFGESSGLVIESTRNQGTKVTLSWPKTL